MCAVLVSVALNHYKRLVSGNALSVETYLPAQCWVKLPISANLVVMFENLLKYYNEVSLYEAEALFYCVSTPMKRLVDSGHLHVVSKVFSICLPHQDERCPVEWIGVAVCA